MLANMNPPQGCRFPTCAAYKVEGIEEAIRSLIRRRRNPLGRISFRVSSRHDETPLKLPIEPAERLLRGALCYERARQIGFTGAQRGFN